MTFQDLVVTVDLNVHVEGAGFMMPTEDVSPREAVLLAMILTSGIAGAPVDYKKFVHDNKLGRHFQNKPATKV